MHHSFFCRGAKVITVLLCVFGCPVFAYAGTGDAGAGKTRAFAPPPPLLAGEYLPHLVIVKFKERPAFATLLTTGIATLDHRLQAYGVNQVVPVRPATALARRAASAVDLSRIFFIHFASAVSPARVAEDLRQDESVVYAEPHYLHHLTATPNDPSFADQSFFSAIKAAQAWDLVKGQQGSVVIAVVDGGTERNHPDLQENLWINGGEIPGNGLDDDNNGFVDDLNGWNFSNNTPDPTGSKITPTSANHGTHTAGIACAVTDNRMGVAGVSWNAQLMAINASSATSDRAIAYGYEGIMYAADNGADVISLSWGSSGSASAFEQEVIEYALSTGAAVVAAAGNDNASALFYPAAYRGVLAVANTTNTDVRQGSSNFGAWVDVAAPGTNILSTFSNGQYGSLTGTSMSSPLVAGLVALVKTQHPNWQGIQAAEQVRVTADNIDAQNPGYAGLLGRGRVNAQRATTESSPALRLVNASFTDGDGDGVIEPGESITVQTTIINYLAPALNVTLTLSESDAYVTLNTATVALGSIGTLEQKNPATSFRFTVASNAPSGHPVEFTLNFSAGGYNDKDRFSLTILPTYGSLSVNNLETTVTNIGRLGYADPDQSGLGLGFKYQGGPNLLYEGAIICGNSLNRISNAARGNFANNQLSFDADFTVASGGDLRIARPGARSDQESLGIFEDRAAGNPMNIRITQETFAASRAVYEDVILFRYTVENLNTTELSNFYFGNFFDWDIGASGAGDIAEYDSERRMGYSYNTTNGPKTYVGMALLEGANPSFRAITNNQSAAGNPWGIYDGFTDTEKWESLLGGVSITKAGPEDVSFLLGSGPHRIPANGTITLGFALVAGIDKQDLQTNADFAMQFWQELFQTAVDDKPSPSLPRSFALEQNYPNPFNPSTRIDFQLPQAAPVRVEIFDLRGRKIRTLAQRQLPAGFYSETWDGKDEAGVPVPTGIYVYRLQARNFVQSRKMMLLH